MSQIQATIVMLDVRGYTKLEQAGKDLFADFFFPTADRVVSENQLEVVDMNTWGDAVVAVFRTSEQAFKFAFDIKRNIEEDQTFPELTSLQVRVAVHRGLVHLITDPVRSRAKVGSHCHGPAFILPARLEEVGSTSTIVATEEAVNDISPNWLLSQRMHAVPAETVMIEGVPVRIRQICSQSLLEKARTTPLGTTAEAFRDRSRDNVIRLCYESASILLAYVRQRRSRSKLQKYCLAILSRMLRLIELVEPQRIQANIMYRRNSDLRMLITTSSDHHHTSDYDGIYKIPHGHRTFYEGSGRRGLASYVTWEALENRCYGVGVINDIYATRDIQFHERIENVRTLTYTPKTVKDVYVPTARIAGAPAPYVSIMSVPIPGPTRIGRRAHEAADFTPWGVLNITSRRPGFSHQDCAWAETLAQIFSLVVHSVNVRPRANVRRQEPILAAALSPQLPSQGSD